MATFQVDGTKTTVSFEYTALTAKIADVLSDASEYLWKEELDEEGKVLNPFADATNQEKLNVVDAHVKRVIIDLANTFKSNKAQKEARELEADSEHII